MVINIYIFDKHTSQIALLRIGRTDNGVNGTGANDMLMTPEEVAAALATPLPSELLLKGY